LIRSSITAKLATVHGQPAADELVNSVNRNLAFRNTHQKVVESSQTAQRQAAANAMKPVPAGEVSLVNPNMTTIGLALAGGEKALRAAYGAVRPDPTRSNGEIAKVPTEQGAQRDARIARGGNAAVGTAIGDPAGLLAAIAANSALRANPKRNRD
jgi:hypothetical protein